MSSSPCVRSGWCCKQGPCPFGKWDVEKNQCSFLGGDIPGEHFCEKYDEIMEDPSSWVSPAFGAGCCLSLNGDRQKVLLLRAAGD